LFVSQTVVYIRFRRRDGENVKLLLLYLTDNVVSKWKFFSVIFWRPFLLWRFSSYVHLSLWKEQPDGEEYGAFLEWYWQGKSKCLKQPCPRVSFIRSFILLSALRQVHRLFQSHFSTECDLVLHLSILSLPSLLRSSSSCLHLLRLLIVTSILPSLYPQQISHGMGSFRTRFSTVTGRWVTARAMELPL